MIISSTSSTSTTLLCVQRSPSPTGASEGIRNGSESRPLLAASELQKASSAETIRCLGVTTLSRSSRARSGFFPEGTPTPPGPQTWTHAMVSGWSQSVAKSRSWPSTFARVGAISCAAEGGTA